MVLHEAPALAVATPRRRVTQLEVELKSVSLKWPVEPEGSQTSFTDWDKPSCTETCSDTYYASSNFDYSFNSRPESDDTNHRMVRFDEDDNGIVRATEFPAPSICLTQKEISSLWWKPIEFKYFKRYSKKMCVAAQNSEYLQDFKSFYEGCGCSQSIKKNDVRCYARLCNAPARGLEVPIFAHIMADRKLTIDGILKAQNKVTCDMDSKHKSKVLAATSRYLTKHARIMAYSMGQGDAAIARAIHRKSEGETGLSMSKVTAKAG